MTVYFMRIFLKITEKVGWHFERFDITDADRFLHEAKQHETAKILMIDTVFHDTNQLPRHFIGSHIIRDPRDLLVSGYNYHKWCTENWVLEPLSGPMQNYLRLKDLNIKSDISGFSYQELLNYVDQETGLTIELNHRAESFRYMKLWNYKNRRIMELRYEQIMGNEIEVFTRLFRHYKFNKELTSKSLEFVKMYSFENQKKQGYTGEKQHLSKGNIGQWRDSFSPAFKDLFKERHQGLLVKLGYENDDNW